MGKTLKFEEDLEEFYKSGIKLKKSSIAYIKRALKTYFNGSVNISKSYLRSIPYGVANCKSFYKEIKLENGKIFCTICNERTIDYPYLKYDIEALDYLTIGAIASAIKYRADNYNHYKNFEL